MQEETIRLSIIIAPFYTDITEHLLTGAQDYLREMNKTTYHDALIWDITSVPGALEIPAAIAIREKTDPCHGYIALGCVIQGETRHYDIVAGESARGLMNLTLKALPIGNGILTCDSHDQARKRADPKQGNKGADAANAALTLINQKYKRTNS